MIQYTHWQTHTYELKTKFYNILLIHIYIYIYKMPYKNLSSVSFYKSLNADCNHLIGFMI